MAKFVKTGITECRHCDGTGKCYCKGCYEAQGKGRSMFVNPQIQCSVCKGKGVVRV